MGKRRKEMRARLEALEAQHIAREVCALKAANKALVDMNDDLEERLCTLEDAQGVRRTAERYVVAPVATYDEHLRVAFNLGVDCAQAKSKKTEQPPATTTTVTENNEAPKPKFRQQEAAAPA